MSNRDTEAVLVNGIDINLGELITRTPETALELAIRRIMAQQGDDAHRGFSSII